MNKKRVEALIPFAMEEIAKNFEKEGKVDKIYSSYLASFGPSVITSGVLMSVMFYSGDEKKRKIIDLMGKVLKDGKYIENENLIEFVKENYYKNRLKTTELVIDANIACKLAIRTFTLVEEKEENEE
jgi:CRISPR/Cas system CMR-associated protein Cmr5 small subunit